jgi:hypothetical protein
MGRLIVMAIMGAGVVVGGPKLGELMDKVLDTYRSLATTYELATIRERIVTDYESSGTLPRTMNEEAMTEYIHEVMRVHSGARDPAIDLWQNPYLFDDGSEPNWYLVFSTGPNGEADSCKEDGGDDVCAWMELEKTQSVYKQIR